MFLIRMYTVRCTILIFTICFIPRILGFNCGLPGYNLEALDRVRLPWTSQTRGDNNEPKTFLISLCRPLSVNHTECSTNTSVCLISNSTAISAGNFSTRIEAVQDGSADEIRLTLLGDDCGSSDPKSSWKTFIVFKCGKTLGFPEHLASYACDNYFEWNTIAACKTKGVSPPYVAESICYAFDSDGKRRDLSKLIKLTGAYSIMTDDGSAMYINVCRDITAGHPCEGTAACVVRDNSTVGVGRVQPAKTRLQFDRYGSLILEYSANSTNDNHLCVGGQISTVIHFRCPTHRQGSVPMQIESNGCHHEVMWETEYACPEDYLLSKTCHMNVGQHGVEVDLTPLASALDMPYVVNGTDSKGKVYTYKLEICSNRTVPCSNALADSVVCQTDTTDSRRSYSLGRYNQQILRYSDGELSLIYGNGTACGNGYHRETVIHFHCNSSAGRGSPVFSSEDKCTYIFEWETSYACITSPQSCRIYGNKMYDLSPLTHANDEANWKVFSEDRSEQFLINVCRNVTAADEGATCPSTSAACLVKNNGATRSAVSLGQFAVAPSYNSVTELVSLSYSNGDLCNSSGKRYSARIIFRCKPGYLSAPPELLESSDNSCHYEFVWYTASACSAIDVFGDKCTVEDTNSGYSFDLNSLTSASGFYVILSNSTGRRIYINVCDKLRNSPCISTSDEEPGVCVIDTDGRNSKIVGISNRTLWYRSGVLKLVYGTADNQTTRTEIIFLCDAEAGVGTPYLEEVDEGLFVITWYTAYACPPEAVDCSAEDPKTGTRYDLSSLMKSDETSGNWITAVTLPDGSSRQLQINFCRPVVPKAYSGNSACEPAAGACATEFLNDQESVVAANIGRSLYGPQILPNGSLILEYVNGGACIDVDNTTKKYSLTVLLRCDSSPKNPDASVERFSVAVARGNCAYYATLETASACPVQSLLADLNASCTILDSKTGVTYSLMPMKAANNSHFIVAVGERMLEMNICGTLPDCSNADASICDGKTIIGLASTAQMQLINGMLQLIYKDDSGRVKVRISFQCDLQVAAGTEKPTFIGYSGQVYSFDVMTSLACSPSVIVNCQAYDRLGRKYDLSPLTRQDDYLLSVPNNSSEKLIINVCRAIGADHSSQMCSGKRSGGCHITADGIEHNTGYLQSAPGYFNDELSIHYVNGDACGTNHFRSTRIVFICSDVQREPTLVSYEECAYLIRWLTPFACPLERVVGADCRVIHPLYHSYTFNLRELQNTGLKMWTVPSTIGNFTLNVCGPLRSSSLESGCGAVGGVGACLQQNNSFIDIGNFNENLEYEDGQLLLVYSDGKKNCNGGNNRTTTIIFTCHHELRGSNGPQFLQSQSTDCSFYFEWPTVLACLPLITACSLTASNGDFYDLSPLTLDDDNYKVSVQDGAVTRLFTINICTTVVHARGALCPMNSAACMMTADRNYTSIGAVNKSALSVVSSGHLTLRYSNGDICRGTQLYETVIKFLCPLQGEGDDLEFVSLENCTYTFFWLTKSACPVSRSSSGNCSVKDPMTGFIYDMSPLKVIPMYEIDQDNDHVYFLSVCAPLVNSSCNGINSGSCQREKSGQKRSFNAGNATSELQLEDGMPVMIYSGGDMCRRNKMARRTIVNFVCTHHGSDNDESLALGQPQFDMEDDCSYFMSWHTSLACQNQIRCAARADGQTIDLSSLMPSVDLTLAGPATAANNSIFMSLCRPLNKINGKRCPLGAAVCLQTADGKLMSLGRLNSSAVWDTESQSVSLLYAYGSNCSSEPGQRWTSVIHFICDRQSLTGKPVLNKVEKCQYQFEWRTSAVCGQSALVGSPAGCLFSSESNLTFDLSGLQNKSFQIQGESSKFYLNVCGSPANQDCSSSAVCRIYESRPMSVNYSLHNVLLESGVLKVVYVEKQSSSECASGTDRTVTLHLHCDSDASDAENPVIQLETECAVMLALRTPLIYCTPIHHAIGQVITSPTLRIPTSSPISTVVMSTAITVHDDVTPSGHTNGLALTIGIVVLCVGIVLSSVSLVAVLRSSSRRHAVGVYVTSCLQNCSYNKPSGYNLLGGREGVAAVRESESLLSHSTLGNIQHYDSDDDLLL